MTILFVFDTFYIGTNITTLIRALIRAIMVGHPLRSCRQAVTYCVINQIAITYTLFSGFKMFYRY